MARPDQVESVLLDASSLLGVVTGDPDFACLRSLMTAVDRGEVQLVESTAALIEVRPFHDSDSETNGQARADLLALLQSSKTQLVDVTTVVARKAGQLAADLKLTNWDAVHLATAILAQVDVLVVRDGAFPEGDYEGVYVTGPYDHNEGTIFGLMDQP